jgi:CBS domain containing-hemolysin-like protein
MIPLLVTLTVAGLLFVALVETAFGLLMRLPQRLEAERDTESDALSAYLDDPITFFLPARLLRGTLIVLLVALLAQVFERGLTGGLMLFAAGALASAAAGQLAPLLIARRSPERILELLLPAFTVMAALTGPFTALALTWMGQAPDDAKRNHRENGATATAGAAADAPAEAESEEQADRLLRSVVAFGETLVREVMTPRPDIVAIQAAATIDDLRRLVREQEYSRLPVYADNLDNIVGLIVVKDLIQTTADLDGSHPVAELMRPAAFVPETKRAVDLLREFQQGRFQLAMVVDEYGGTAGLVTVEDLLEELVGEIRDEYDSEAEPVVREADDTFVFSAKVATSELADRLGIEIEDDAYETVGGYVLAEVGRVPNVGERFEFDGLGVEILEAEGRRIHKVRIRRVPAPVAAEPEA